MASRFAARIVSGEPGQAHTNDGPKILYQLIVSFTNSCGQCIQFANQLAPSWPVPFHRGCRCRTQIIRPGATAAPFLDYRAEIAKLDHAQQSRVVGRANLTLIERGVIGWDDVVTPSRVRSLQEVVSRKRLDVGSLTKAGVRKDIAEKAHAAVNTPAHEIAAAERKAALEKLAAKGISDSVVRRAVATDLASRVGIDGPSGRGRIAPTPPAPPTPPPILPPKPRPTPGRRKKPAVPTPIPVPVPIAAPRPAPSPAVVVAEADPVSRGEPIPPRAATAKPAQSSEPKYHDPEARPARAFFRGPSSGEGKEVLDRAFNAIDKVHRLRVIDEDERIPIQWDTIAAMKGADGLAHLRRDRGDEMRSEKIRIAREGRYQSLSLVHELGHALDAETLGGTLKLHERDWSESPSLSAVRDAWKSSRAYRSLESLEAGQVRNLPRRGGGETTYVVDGGFRDYFLKQEEVWARAYAQYITTRSGDPTMRAELLAVKYNLEGYSAQWDDDDFEPIAQAMDNLFRRRGWLNE